MDNKVIRDNPDHKRVATENKEWIIRIIRFSDGQLMSFVGTLEEAEEYAMKESRGRRYDVN